MSEIFLAGGERAAKARANGHARVHGNRPSSSNPPAGMVERIREYPNGRRIAREFGVSHAFVCKVAKRLGIKMDGRRLDGGDRHTAETIMQMRATFAECGSLGKAAKAIGISYDTAKEWCRIYGWRDLEKPAPQILRWRCGDCGRLNTGKDCTRCGNVPIWAKPDEPWTGDR